MSFYVNFSFQFGGEGMLKSEKMGSRLLGKGRQIGKIRYPSILYYIIYIQGFPFEPAAGRLAACDTTKC